MMMIPDYGTKALNLHNAYRAQHNSPPLRWSPELHLAAMRHAVILAGRKSDKLEPKANVKWGQNVFELQSWNVTISDETAVDRAIKSWYHGIKDYKWNESTVPGTKSGLNFSQLIWLSTTELGVGIAKNKNGNLLVVAGFYDPAGNYKGEFQSNVLPRIRKASLPKIPPTIPRSLSTTPSPPTYSAHPHGVAGSLTRRTRDPSVPQWLSEAVDLHNKFRRKHGSPSLQLNQKLSDQAQVFADGLIMGTEGPGTLGKGRNVYRVYGALSPLEAVRKAVPKWYSQNSQYNWSAPLLSGPQANLFANLLWRSSRGVGVGVATHDSDASPLTVVVACYSPPVNSTEEKHYRENVRSALF